MPFELRFLDSHNAGRPAGDGLRFLHEVRSPRSKCILDFDTSECAYAYFKRHSYHTQRFSELVSSIDCDLIVAPPSQRQDADPYIAAARTLHRNAHLIPRSAFKKTKPAGELATPLEFLPHLDFNYFEAISSYRKVLIVDDVYSKGVTTGGIIYRMREKGLPLDAVISVACPLWAHDEADSRRAKANQSAEE